jgi:hypothetical protein
VVDGIGRELVQLQAINKKEPTKKFVGRKKRPRMRKDRNVTRKPSARRGMASSLGNTTSMDSRRNPDFWI